MIKQHPKNREISINLNIKKMKNKIKKATKKREVNLLL